MSSASPERRIGVDAVFVYSDGQVGLVTLPIEREPANWRRPIRSAIVSVMFDPPVRTTVETEEFTRRGRMFDGRPIYCADGFDVKEAHQIHTVTLSEYASEGVRDDMRRNMDRFVRGEEPGAIVLDQWKGDVPFTFIEEGMKQAGLRKVGLRTLVAIRTQKRCPPRATFHEER